MNLKTRRLRAIESRCHSLSRLVGFLGPLVFHLHSRSLHVCVAIRLSTVLVGKKYAARSYHHGRNLSETYQRWSNTTCSTQTQACVPVRRGDAKSELTSFVLSYSCQRPDHLVPSRLQHRIASLLGSRPFQDGLVHHQPTYHSSSR